MQSSYRSKTLNSDKRTGPHIQWVAVGRRRLVRYDVLCDSRVVHLGARALGAACRAVVVFAPHEAQGIALPPRHHSHSYTFLAVIVFYFGGKKGVLWAAECGCVFKTPCGQAKTAVTNIRGKKALQSTTTSHAVTQQHPRMHTYVAI